MTLAQLKDWVKSYPGKATSLGVAFLYIVAACFGGIGALVGMITSLILPLACIFWGEALGRMSFTAGKVHSGSRSSPVPGCFMAFIGWALLLLPLLSAVLKVVGD